MIYDRTAGKQIIGSLMKEPTLLLQSDKYNLNKEDFALPVHKMVFSSIYNMSQQGATEIGVVDIHQYLEKYPALYVKFNEEKGGDFIVSAEHDANVETFDVYYDRLKKMSMLKTMKESGFDIEDWYIEGLFDIARRQTMEKKLEESTLEDIVHSIVEKIYTIETNFVNKDSFTRSTAFSGIEELIEGFKGEPDFGHPLMGDMFSTVTRGARKGKLFLYSGASGYGKSRIAVANACYLAYPIRWCLKTHKWVNEGSNDKILFITTEMSKDEIQTMVLAYLTGINEEKILNGDYQEHEWKRVQEALEIMRAYEANFQIYQMPDPNIQQLNANIRRLVVSQKVDALFFDYIHTSPALLGEFSSSRIREDVALLLISNALKNLANELNIFIWSGTQLNANAFQMDFMDEGAIQGSRAIPQKADFGCCLNRVSAEHLKSLSHMKMDVRPNHYIDIYKNRRGRYKRVRLWMEIDLGIMRITDLFMTEEWGDLVTLSILKSVSENSRVDVPNFFASGVGKKDFDVSKIAL